MVRCYSVIASKDNLFLAITDVEALVRGARVEATALEVIPRGVVGFGLRPLDGCGGLHEVEGDGAVARHLDVGNGFRHQLLTVGIGREECGCGGGLVRQTRIHHQGLGIDVGICRRAQILAVKMTLVGPLSLVATCVFGIPVAIGQTVGME